MSGSRAGSTSTRGGAVRDGRDGEGVSATVASSAAFCSHQYDPLASEAKALGALVLLSKGWSAWPAWVIVRRICCRDSSNFQLKSMRVHLEVSVDQPQECRRRDRESEGSGQSLFQSGKQTSPVARQRTQTRLERNKRIEKKSWKKGEKRRRRRSY